MEEMTRDEYIHYRQEDDQAAILAAYFGDKSGNILETNSFALCMFAAIEDDPILQKKIDYQYPLIIEYYDKLFSVNFLIKDYGPDNRVLLMIY